MRFAGWLSLTLSSHVARRSRLRILPNDPPPSSGWRVSDELADRPYAVRATPTVRRALAETLPEAVATAAFEFITGPLLEQPYRVGKRLLPPLV
jgi:hypothetical protein